MVNGFNSCLLMSTPHEHDHRRDHGPKHAHHDRNLRKNGLSVDQQPIPGDELRAIRRYLKQREDRLPWLLVSELEQAMTRRAVSYIVENAAGRADLGPVHPTCCGTVVVSSWPTKATICG